MLNLKILAIDIGAGTEDILLFDDEKGKVENCIKMVLPSPSQVFAGRVKSATNSRKDILVVGDTMGGGAFASALRRHIKEGLKVVMTEKAAYTVRNDLDEVSSLGVEIIESEDENVHFEGEILSTSEVNFLELEEFLRVFDETILDVDVVAFAVQDHGVSPKGMSNRRFRFKRMKEALKQNPNPESLAFVDDGIPSCFLRMKSVAAASKQQLPKARVLVMDTSPDAILGCLKDPVVAHAKSILAVNVGNGHTMASIICDGEIVGVMEHHTRMLTPTKIERLLVDFVNGDLSDEEIFNDNGHGLFLLSEPPAFPSLDGVVATGPNRDMLAKTGLRVHFAAPAGDMMMTGPIGLVEAVYKRF